MTSHTHTHTHTQRHKTQTKTSPQQEGPVLVTYYLYKKGGKKLHRDKKV